MRRAVRLAPDVRLTSRSAGTSQHALGRLQGLRRAALALAFVAASIGVAPEARAQLDLRWDAPPNCPPRGEVLEQVRAIAGSALDETEGLSVQARITREHGRLRLELLVRDGRDVLRRVMTSDSCSALAGAAAITLALLLGTDADSGAPSASDAPARSEPGARERPEPGASSDDAKRRDESERAERALAASGGPAGSAESTPTRRWAFIIRAPVVAADLGPLPRAVLGVGVGVGMRYSAWGVVLTGQLSREQSIGAPTPGGPFGAELQRATGQLLTCHGWRSRSFELAPCVALALEHVTARGFGDGVSPQARRAVWLAPGAGAVAHWYALKSCALFAGVTGYLELSRPRFVVQDLGEVRQLGPAAIGTVVGLEWIL